MQQQVDGEVARCALVRAGAHDVVSGHRELVGQCQRAAQVWQRPTRLALEIGGRVGEYLREVEGDLLAVAGCPSGRRPQPQPLHQQAALAAEQRGGHAGNLLRRLQRHTSVALSQRVVVSPGPVYRRDMTLRRSARGPVLLLVLALPACATVTRSDGPVTTVPATSSPTLAQGSSAAAGSAAAPLVVATASMLPCPTTNAAPDPKRPVLTAAVSFGADGIVSGTQRVVFTPDLDTGQIYFRLWAAGPKPRAAGGSIVVSRAVINGRARTMERPLPTVLRIPLVGKTPAGTPVTIDLTWRMKLPTGINDRFGRRSETQWFGSGIPLLPWARGRGWALDRETSSFAESSTSEAMQLASLSVTRASGLGVLSTGAPVSDDGRTAVFKARAVRDVAVAVGRFATKTVSVDGLPVVVGVAPGVSESATTVSNELVRSIRVHRTRFGPFPYERLATAVLPDLSGGIEYPGMIMLGKGQTDDATASHEVAHEWFYGLVGNNQGKDPWLDESLATYAEGLDRGTLGSYERTTIPADGKNRVGAPMIYWEGRSSYYRSVYIQGAAALSRARRAVGAAALDKAIGCHVRRNAHRVTTPADVAASLRHLPAAIAELRKVGALP